MIRSPRDPRMGGSVANRQAVCKVGGRAVACRGAGGYSWGAVSQSDRPPPPISPAIPPAKDRPMLQIQQGPAARNCKGVSRRTALKAGFLGLAGLTLPDLLRLRAEGSAEKKDTAVILLWLDGGPSQLETYDPKPDAPSDYRGPYKAIKTNVTGVYVNELLTNHARHMDKMVLVRSLHHDNGDHFAAAHWMLTGRFGSTAGSMAQKYPSVGSYAARVRGANAPGIPAYVGLPAAESVYLFPGYMGAAYLGPTYNPFDV